MDASFSFYPFPREQPKKTEQRQERESWKSCPQWSRTNSSSDGFGEIIEIHPTEPFLQGACVHGWTGLEEHSHFARCAQ